VINMWNYQQNTSPPKRGSGEKRIPVPPETKYFDSEPFELLYLGASDGPIDGGYKTKAKAQKNAQEWRDSGDECRARTVKIGDYYYVYGW